MRLPTWLTSSEVGTRIMARGRPVVGCGALDKGGDSSSNALRFLRFSSSMVSL